MAWKIPSLEAGKVLDMPLMSKYHNPSTDILTDKSAYGNHGANNGADVDVDHSTFVAANSDYVRIADSPSLSPTVAMTAMIWVKGAAQDVKYILSHFDYSANEIAFGIRTQTAPNNKITVLISDDGTWSSGHKKHYDSSIVVFDNAWHMVGFIFDAGTLKLYIDNTEDTNPTMINDDPISIIHDSTVDIMCGSTLDSGIPVNFSDGDLARLRMWNRALTATEWKLAFDQESGLYL